MRIREVRQKAQTEVNIKAEDGDRGAEDGDRRDLATIMLSDGGLANPAFPSLYGIAPCGLSVSYSYAHSHTHRTPHSHTHSPPHSDTHSTHSTPYSDTHSDTHGPPHSDTHSIPHSPPHSDTHSFPHKGRALSRKIYKFNTFLFRKDKFGINLKVIICTFIIRVLWDC